MTNAETSIDMDGNCEPECFSKNSRAQECKDFFALLQAKVNRLTGRPLAEIGVATDKTRAAETYDWNGIHLVDLPGYDTARFPREQYFTQLGIENFDLLSKERNKPSQ